MSSTIFNSQFENCMRLLVALDKLETAVTATELADADFAATYARHFGLGRTDLHGSTALMRFTRSAEAKLTRQSRRSWHTVTPMQTTLVTCPAS